MYMTSNSLLGLQETFGDDDDDVNSVQSALLHPEPHVSEKLINSDAGRRVCSSYGTAAS